MNLNTYPKLERFIYLTVSLILGTFFSVIGLFSLTLPWSSFLQTTTIRFLTEQTLILSLFGLGFVGIGVSLILYTIFNAKRHQAYIKMGANSVSIGQELIERYLESYWQKSFPHHSIPFYLTIRKHSLQIVADLPPLPESEQPFFLEKIKSDLSDLFGRVLGYPYDVHFIAHFQTNESELKMRSND